MKRWRETDGVHLDLRGLLPPDPMIEVLREIDGGADCPLILHMDREPIYLYQELEDRGWSGRMIDRGNEAETADTTVIMELRPEAAP